MDAITILGLEIKVEDWNHKNDIPMYITNVFIIQKANINGINCIMLTPKDDLPNTPSLKKHIETIRDVDNLSVFININHLSCFRKENLLRNKIPFVFKKQFVYLPFLGTVLIEDKSRVEKKINKFTISAQLLFIWILYRQTEKYYIMDAIQDLPFSNMTLTRAYRQLIATNLFTEHKEGRKIYLTSSYSKKELFEKTMPFFTSSIVNVGYLSRNQYIPEMIASGETALSEHTLLNPPLLPVYALDKKYKKAIEWNDELIDPQMQMKVELWDYDPLMFSNNKKAIDILSLIISLKENKDERIEVAIADLLTHVLGG